MKNYYELLEVDKNASAAIIKAVYKIHIKKKHPDLFQGEEKEKAEEELKILNEAYEILSDEQKRAEYDKTLKEQSVDKELFDEIMQENIMLKDIIEGKEKEVNLDEQPKSYFEYEPTPYETEQNNTKYLMKLIWKERALRLVIVLVFIIAFAVSIYKVSGVNIFESFWNAVLNIFGGNN